METLLKTVNKWLAIRDKEGITAIMCVALHAAMLGDPLWLLIVNVPGTAKTELLRSFTGTKINGKDFVYTVDSLAPRQLVSGLVTEDKKDPSLLPKINDKLLIIKDFSEILSSNWGEQKKVYADLRQAYDGYLEKPFGSGAGKRGGYAHFGILAAATPIIDTFNVLTQQLGERFLRLRLQINEDEAVDKASEVAGNEDEMRRELGHAFRTKLEEYIDNLNIANTLKLQTPDDKIKPLAKLIASLRTEVLRDRSRYVKIPPEPEVGTRLVKQLKSLYRMTVVVQNGNYHLVKRVAADCIPRYRLRILEALQDGDWWKVDDISLLTGIPRRTCDERLEDLELLGILDVNTSNSVAYKINGRIQDYIEKAELL